MAAKKALGRGLDALISEAGEEGAGIHLIPLAEIAPNRSQPRKSFDRSGLEELAGSIKENGVIQPVVVREAEQGFELVVGERRLRAARLAGLEKIPAVIKDYSAEKALELALIENIQREDLNPIEEAGAYRMILERDMITQEELARRVGKSRSYLANMVRLLDLPGDIQEHVSRGTLSVGQARAVISLPPEEQHGLVQRMLEEQLTVREVERLAAKKPVSRETKRPPREPFLEEIEERLRARLGTKVLVDYRGGKGAIRIDFYSDDDLERVLGLIEE
ncbi:MAG: ParB/RepB/Spo0J family partition protein [Spirochaetota bacterium]